MNKRSAIAVAAGLTGALVSGVAGYSVRVGNTATPEAAPPRPAHREAQDQDDHHPQEGQAGGRAR